MSGAKKRSGDTSSSCRSGVGDELRRGHAGMRAVVVENEHVFGRLHVARQNIPARHGELGAFLDRAILRQAAGRDDDDVGVRGRAYPAASTKVLNLMSTPRRSHCSARQSAMPISSARRLTCVARRIWPPGSPEASKQDHLMAARGGDARRFEAGGAGADDDDLPAGAIGSS